MIALNGAVEKPLHYFGRPEDEEFFQSFFHRGMNS
jgi:hypothetical protein